MIPFDSIHQKIKDIESHLFNIKLICTIQQDKIFSYEWCSQFLINITLEYKNGNKISSLSFNLKYFDEGMLVVKRYAIIEDNMKQISNEIERNIKMKFKINNDLVSSCHKIIEENTILLNHDFECLHNCKDSRVGIESYLTMEPNYYIPK
jgi:ABC-type phosphate transport system auxiliary subunit